MTAHTQTHTLKNPKFYNKIIIMMMMAVTLIRSNNTIIMLMVDARRASYTKRRLCIEPDRERALPQAAMVMC